MRSLLSALGTYQSPVLFLSKQTSNQPVVLFSYNKLAPATSQPNRLIVWSLHSLLVYTSDYILYIRLVTVNCIYSCLIRWSYTVESYYNVDYASLSIHWLLLGVICHWCTSTHTTISHVIAARRLGMYVLESHVDAGLTAGDLVPCAVCLLWIMWFNLYLCVVNDDGRAHRCGVCATSPTEDKL
jgi:hypothetical protein